MTGHLSIPALKWWVYILFEKAVMKGKGAYGKSLYFILSFAVNRKFL